MIWVLLFYTISALLGVSLLHSLKIVNIGVYFVNYVTNFILLNVENTKSQSNYSLIVGPSGSGKTTLFHKLIQDKLTKTTTSIIPGVAKVKEGKQLVDIPGNRRIISNLILKYLKDSVSIIFVIDSNDKSSFKDAAEILFLIICEVRKIKIFTNNRFEDNKHKYKVLVLCNKSDLISSRNVSYIKDELERSIERLLNTQYCNFENDLSDLIEKNKPFSFENLHYINFQFMKFSNNHLYDEFKHIFNSFLE